LHFGENPSHRAGTALAGHGNLEDNSLHVVEMKAVSYHQSNEMPMTLLLEQPIKAIRKLGRKRES
jgi:hypothetical protein